MKHFVFAFSGSLLALSLIGCFVSASFAWLYEPKLFGIRALIAFISIFPSVGYMLNKQEKEKMKDNHRSINEL